MKIFLPLFILALSFTAYAQKTVSELKPTHAIALEKFLSAHKNYEFMSETLIQAETLRYMRQTWGKDFHPFYATGDFNRDRLADFAVLLTKKLELVPTISADQLYPSLIVIFNRGRGGAFSPVFTKEIEASRYCFLNIDGVKKKELYFGVFESDADTMIFTPAGKGYIVEYPEAP